MSIRSGSTSTVGTTNDSCTTSTHGKSAQRTRAAGLIASSVPLRRAGRVRRSAQPDRSAHEVSRGAYLMNLGLVPYGEAFDLQRSLAGAVSQGAIPETVVFLEHPPVITVGRRTETDRELHVPEDAEVEIAETDRGGKSTFHGPGQLVCYPILDLANHGKDVKRYVRDLEEALIRTLGAFDLEGRGSRV